MLGYVLLGLGLLLVLGPAALVGLVEFRYRVRRERQRRELQQLKWELGRYHVNGTGQLDDRDRRRIVQRELDRLRR